MNNKSLIEQHVTGLESLSRWCALLSGLDLINQSCEERGVDDDDVRLETRALELFVAERSGDVLQGFRELAAHHKMEEEVLFKLLIHKKTFSEIGEACDNLYK